MEPLSPPKSKRGFYILVTIVALLLVGAAVFALQNSKPDPVNSQPTKTETTVVAPEKSAEDVPAPSERMVIQFTDEGFVPADITVKKGTTITVTNKSSKKVQFSSDDHPVHQDNEEMNLNTIGPEESATYKATKVGKWGFHDHIDDRKTGSVTVAE